MTVKYTASGHNADNVRKFLPDADLFIPDSEAKAIAERARSKGFREGMFLMTFIVISIMAIHSLKF